MEKTVQECHNSKFVAYVEKLNKKAVKIGCAPLNVTLVGEKLVRDEALWEESNQMIERFNKFFIYNIEGETPVINGWEFVARIEHDSVLGNIVRVAPGKDLPIQYREVSCGCDHCNTKRFRKDTFILREVSTGTYKQIGRQCVRDFIGYENPADMHWWVSVMDDISEEVDSYGCGISEMPIFRTEYILTLTLACINQWGYVSGKMAQEREITSTSGDVSGLLFSFKLDAAQKEVLKDAFSGKYDEEVAKIMNWIKGWSKEEIDRSDFNFNVNKLVTIGQVRSNMFGFVTCLPTMFAKHQGLLEEKAAKSNEFLGVVGSKISTAVKVSKVMLLSSAYGVVTLIMMEDAAGNSLKWFASGSKDVKMGDAFTVSGTVKAHDVYQDRNQTTLTRCKFN